jgi:chemotaxis protein methyltransferase CheR
MLTDGVMTDTEFKFISDLIYKRAKIVIRSNKRSMLQGRLAKRLRSLQLPDVRTYIKLISAPEGEDELGEMLNAVTTNVTAFFREPHHFKHLAETMIPEALARHASARRLRIWSAGCSTGQEPYSIAMTMANALEKHGNVDARILATDLDSTVIAHAEAGCYGADDTAPVPAALAAKYLKKTVEGQDMVVPRLRELIMFKQLNLMGNWPMRGPFDAVFCRNVVIYFDKPTQAKLFKRIAEMMAPGGWLYIGHSESLFKVSDDFELTGKTIYRKIS